MADYIADHMSAAYRDRAQLWAYMQDQEEVQHFRLEKGRIRDDDDWLACERQTDAENPEECEACQ